MEQDVNKIVNLNKSLFGDTPQVRRVNAGFTNTIFIVDEKYIIKVCNDINNEKNFKKEIDFYKSNKNNQMIPKLYLYSIDKLDVPYMYEVLEKIDWVTLYDVWHTLEETERENIIKQLCGAMKDFHSNVGPSYDWIQKTKDLFLRFYNESKDKGLFDKEERLLLDNAYSYFDDYLEADEFVLVHNDLHFDNIFYNEGKIKLIDFERSIYAPRDFELDIIYRMIRKPWKFASEENEKNTKLEDYKNIMNYIEKYYPEIIHIDNLYKRLAIYDIIYYLKQYVKNPNINELKTDIMNAANIVVGQQLYLREPSFKDKDEIVKMCNELNTCNDEYPFEGASSLKKVIEHSFEYWLEGCEADKNIELIYPEYSNSTTYLLVDDNNHVYGITHLRSDIKGNLINIGGNIGYIIRPSARNKGYATTQLNLVLSKAKHMGLKKVLITCRENNYGSKRVIEKCGGKQDKSVPSKYPNIKELRYWIEL